MNVKAIVAKYDLKFQNLEQIAFNAVRLRGVRPDADLLAQALLGICEGLAGIDPSRVNHVNSVRAFVKYAASNAVRRHTDSERRAYRAASAIYDVRAVELGPEGVDDRLDGTRELNRALRAFDAAVLAEAELILIDASCAGAGTRQERAAASRWDALTGKDAPPTALYFIGARLAERMVEAGYSEVDRSLCLELLETHNLSSTCVRA